MVPTSFDLTEERCLIRFEEADPCGPPLSSVEVGRFFWSSCLLAKGLDFLLNPAKEQVQLKKK